jgi:hypothetical protein
LLFSCLCDLTAAAQDVRHIMVAREAGKFLGWPPTTVCCSRGAMNCWSSWTAGKPAALRGHKDPKASPQVPPLGNLDASDPNLAVIVGFEFVLIGRRVNLDASLTGNVSDRTRCRGAGWYQ